MSFAIEEMPWLVPVPSNFRDRCRNIEQQPETLQELLSLSGYALDEVQLGLLRGALTRCRKNAQTKSLAPLTLAVLGNGTTTQIGAAIEATGVRYGFDLRVIDLPYGSVAQQMLDPESDLQKARPAFVLATLDERSLGFDGLAPLDGIGAQRVVGEALSIVRLANDAARAMGSILLVQNFALPMERIVGNLEYMFPGTRGSLIEQFNKLLMQQEILEGSLLLDISWLAQLVGLTRWHDSRLWNLAKFPFSSRFLPLYADHVCRLIACARGQARKCLVLDLDNTLWGGAIGDDGLEGIVLGQGNAVGEAFVNIQRTALALQRRGIILAVCSKNEEATALAAFQQHPDMVLRFHHIACFVANWQEKSEGLRQIAYRLNIGLESLVMLDDNPAERSAIRAALPMVAVPELPADPALFPVTLLSAGYFETVGLTKEDADRGEMYCNSAKLASLRANFASQDDYLRNLNMMMTVDRFTTLDRSRVTQLINKTNQFNLTTRRYSESEVSKFGDDDNYFTLTARLADRFGDNGLISVIICKIEGKRWDIDTWLMSCRVLGRCVEMGLLQVLAMKARERGADHLIGNYIPTAKNGLVEEHYKKLGFKIVESTTERTRWEFDLRAWKASDVPITTIFAERFQREMTTISFAD